MQIKLHFLTLSITSQTRYRCEANVSLSCKCVKPTLFVLLVREANANHVIL